MGIYVNPNNENLKIDMASPIYVDKSMLIVEINRIVKTNKRFVCVSRSRRFGKTMAANMLSAYFSKGSDSRDLFANLKIAKDPSFEKYLNKFNVIKLDVNAIYSNRTPEEIEAGISIKDRDIVPIFTKKIVSELQTEFPAAGIDGKESIADALLKIYATTGEQFVVIIDEYDVLIRERVSDQIFKSYLSFLNAMFKNDNLAPGIALAYITGILPVVRDKVQSKLNVFREYTMAGASRLSEFVGFTAEETQKLCTENGLDFEECKRWYDGYNLNGIKIYSPNSIVEAIDKGKMKSYWTQTGSYEALKNYILMDFEGILQDVKTMIGGGKVHVDVSFFLNTMTDFHDKDDIFTFLIHLGYLAYDEDAEECYIPNREIREQWIKSIKSSPDYRGVMELVNSSKQLVESTIEGEADAVATALDKAHEQICSNLNYNNEGTFQAVICLAYFYANLKYTIIKECPAGKGVADVVMIPYVPNTPALIIELKRNKCEKTALTQIREKNYGAALEKYSGDLLFVGVNYDEQTKEHKCVIEKFVK
jgi:hypothetical protein